MEVVWRKRALNDLARFHEWLCTIEGADADRVTLRIGAASDMLARSRDIGRPGAKAETRELALRNPPYVSIYWVNGSTIEILAGYHAAQSR
jgi:plasmid stabilization system protein ParE